MSTLKSSWKEKLLPNEPVVGRKGLSRRHKFGLLGVVIFLVVAGALIGGLVGGLINRNRIKSGCGSTSAWQFDSTSHSNVTMGNRTFFVHLPPSYNMNTRYPVVLSFHGNGDNETWEEHITGLSEPNLQINGQDIIAVYPAGAYGPGKYYNSSSRAWQGAPYSPYGVDDVAFTENMVRELQSNLCVDNSRLYASGKSNGGAFTNVLACTKATAAIFAAFAPVSAALYPTADPTTEAGCNPGRAVPLVNFHGLADPLIPFDGQAGLDGNTTYALPNIDVWRELWALRNGCQSENSSVTYPFPNTSMNLWNCSSTNPAAIVIGYSVAGLGHSWPGTLGFDGGVTAYNATTAAIIPFFNNHTL